jgi:hypothetical protein
MFSERHILGNDPKYVKLMKQLKKDCSDGESWVDKFYKVV